ncbi:MAG: DEAD/DEAH box helicase, partial [Deferrisomatales bacterium]
MAADPLSPFAEPTRAWFSAAFAAPTPVQRRGWEAIARGEHALLVAPTGSGKTLAAFLWGLDALARVPPGAAPGVRLLYVSPLKALVYDVERNLRAPLAGVRRAAEGLGLAPRAVAVDVRTGDTPARDRRRQARRPADLLVTTPESLFLLLGSGARATLSTVETVIV